MGDSMKAVVETLDPVTRCLLPPDISVGTLVPLKTILELRDYLSLCQVYVTRAPQKSASGIIDAAKRVAGDNDTARNLPHLRRCIKPADLPPHLKTAFVNEGNGRSVHMTKAQWLYIILGPKKELSYEGLQKELRLVDGMEEELWLGEITVPLLAPTSQVQANMWSQEFWQTIYRKNNPLGPHPSTISRTETTVARDAAVWIAVAQNIAEKAYKAGMGEPIGAVIVKQAKETTQIVAIAGDARWHEHDGSFGCTGNPMSHAALRAISMVAQKLVRAESRPESEEQIMEFECFKDRPLLHDEQTVFDLDHPSPDGYLCHDLELYLTHEPCTMCSMGILHSRMGKIVFCRRMPLTGGMTSEDRAHDVCEDSGDCEGSCGGGQGLGLHWRKELNWTLLGWEFESDKLDPLPIDPHVHA
ncbi:cytidine deaminase-like protein [Annulohypoxylon bovei var. microspora]|nr:cytidine deaminase-like protein [Annulohypoxylon bovei var. microspora]